MFRIILLTSQVMPIVGQWYFEYSEYLGGYTLKNVKYGKYVGYQSAIHGSLAVGIPGQRSWTIGSDRQDPDRFRYYPMIVYIHLN